MARLLSILLAWLIAVAPAYAQQTKAQLNTEVTTNYPDNTTGAITPAILRTTTNDIISSFQQAPVLNAQTGTSYSIVVGDYGKLITFNNAGNVAVTLPQATGQFSTFNVYVKNLGAGTVTITPTTSTINGAAALTLPAGQGTQIVSDGANYQIGNSSAVISVTDYTACNGTGDDTTGIQRAINLVTKAGIVLVPTDSCRISSTLTFTKPVTLLCASADVSVAPNITQITTSANALTIRSGNVNVKNCSIGLAGSPSGTSTGIIVGDDVVQLSCAFVNGNTTVTCATAAFTSADVGKSFDAQSVGVAGAPLLTNIVSVTDATHVVVGTAPGASNAAQTASYGFDYQEVIIENTRVYNFVRALNIVSGSRYHILHSYFLGTDAAIFQNRLWGDSGDGEVIGNNFVGAVAGTHNTVTMNSGGAMRFVSNKILAQASISNCIEINWNYVTSVGPFMASNSIEGSCVNGINIDGSVALNAAILTGNEIAVTGTGIAATPSIAHPSWVFTGNTIRATANNTGMSLANMTAFNIVGNDVQNADASPSGTAYVIASTSSGHLNVGFTSQAITMTNASASLLINNMQGMTFALLPSAAANGSRIYVTDGLAGSATCAGGGSGTYATRINGAWSCGGTGTVTSVQCAGAAFTTNGSCPSESVAIRFGGFDVWQRLVNAVTTIAQAASTTAYVNDGWYLITGANQAATITQATGIATGSRFAATVQRNNGQTGTGVIRYAAPLFADEIALLRGYNIALSFTIKEGANQSFSHAVNYIVYCGTGAPAKRGASAYTGETTPISATATTTTTAARVTAVSAAVIPSNCTQMEIQFNITPSGTAGADDSFTVDDLDVQTVAASTSVAPPFSHWNYDAQLQRAKSVFRVLAGNQSGSRIYPGLTESTSVMSIGGPLSPAMKSVPNVSFAGTAANIVCNDNAANAAFQGTFGTNFSTINTYGIQLNCANTMTAGKTGFVGFTAATEALFLSSEL